MDKNLKICFVSHNASRTGAPIALLNFLKWLKQQGYSRVTLIFLEKGELIGQFQKLYPCEIFESSSNIRIVSAFRKLVYAILKVDIWLFLKARTLPKFDILFLNTIASLKALDILPKDLACQNVAWIHEQPFSISQWYSKYAIPSKFQTFKRIYCVSTITAKWLEKELKIPPSKILIQRPFLGSDTTYSEYKYASQNSSLFFKVGACGMQDWRKGVDLFVYLAHYVSVHYPNLEIKFEWIGESSEMTNKIEYEIEKLKLNNKVVFSGSIREVDIFLREIDIFVLTSREDPFPLVVLESTRHAIPIICFEGVGDISDRLKLIPENVIPYGRIDLMANRIFEYYLNPRLKISDGNIIKSNLSSYRTFEYAESLINSLEQLSSMLKKNDDSIC